MLIFRLLFVCVALSCLARPALADSPSADQAAALQAALRHWMASLVSPAVDVGDAPVKVTAEGGHFRLNWDGQAALAPFGWAAKDLMFSLHATPLDGGRYALDTLVIPSPMVLGAASAVESSDAEVGSDKEDDVEKDTDQADAAQPQGFEMSAGSRSFHGIIDPSFATTSSFDSTGTEIRTVVGTSVSKTAHSTSHATWEPAGGGLLTVNGEAATQGENTIVAAAEGVQVSTFVAKTQMNTKITGVSPDSLAALVRNIAALEPQLAHKTGGALTQPQRKLAHEAVRALASAFQSLEVTQNYTGMKVTYSGIEASLAHAVFSTHMAAPGGKMAWGFGVRVDGLDSPLIPPGVYRDLLPSRVILNPVISGVASADVIALMDRAIDTDSDNTKATDALAVQAMGLLSRGPLEVAIEELLLDIPGASLTGKGVLAVKSPTDISGHARLALEGLDKLIEKISAEPDLQAAAPVMIFLKGVGQSEGKKTVWNVTYAADKILVNGIDLGAMMPGGALRK